MTTAPSPARGPAIRVVVPALLVLVAAAVLTYLAITDPGLIQRRWREMLTMVGGSFIAGSTSEGGGAVAFPVFTKVLHVAPYDSRTFTLGIQTFGMGAATATILARRIHLEWTALFVTAITGALGMVLGAQYAHLSPVTTRIVFTAVQAALGIFLVWTLLSPSRTTNAGHSDPLMMRLLPVAGFLGGVLSSVIGTGADVILFSLCVILCRMSPRTITPTTIVLQWFLSVVGIATHQWLIHDVTPTTVDRLTACAPIVMIFGPVGVLFGRWMSKRALSLLICTLILAEVTTTVILVPLHGTRAILLAATLAAAIVLCVLGAVRSGRTMARLADHARTAPAALATTSST